MVKVIMGLKGSGKTKQLVELINNAVREENGSCLLYTSRWRMWIRSACTAWDTRWGCFS